MGIQEPVWLADYTTEPALFHPQAARPAFGCGAMTVFGAKRLEPWSA